MALPILDGNQSATTLSTILSGGEHTPAHTVVSLGSQAITDITSAVSGVTIAGTVTANLNALNLFDQGSNTFVGEDGNTDKSFGVQIAYVNANTGETNLVKDTQPLPISGTVTANVQGKSQSGTIYDLPVGYREDVGSGSVGVVVPVYPVGGTAGLPFSAANPIEARATVTVGNTVTVAGTVTANIDNFQIIASDSGGNAPILGIQLGYSAGAEDYRYVDLTNPLPVSGTVTVGTMPNGALTTRFGSVTTANTAQITSAVTNASRKYLLVQNIATSTVTIGIGFSPTTTQGIQLTAGAGLTFDAFCPTGGVWWLSSTTGSNFSILEG